MSAFARGSSCLGLRSCRWPVRGPNAQETTATLVGTRSDASGAAVSGVLVKATNLATNHLPRNANGCRRELFPAVLPAGDYSVTASITGFQSQKVDRLTLQVQQTARMDFKLTIGSVTESIDVAATAAFCRPRTPLSAPSSIRRKSWSSR